MAQAKLLLQELKKHHVTHVVGLPDNSSAGLFELLGGDPDIRLIRITREGETFALAAGLWMGGKTPVVLIQNTGLLESGDSLRGTVLRMRIPLLCLITYRGYAGMMRQGLAGTSVDLTADLLSRPDLDSTALITEPTLKAWGLPFVFFQDDEDLPRVSEAFQRAEEESRPIAILITRDLT
jgi:sulfopyruvate decarboxylase TPP-binding subunit